MTTPEPQVAVLIVDDDAGKRLAIRSALAPLDYTLVEAESGRAALRALMTQEFAVILLDVRMPDMDGFETATLIRQRRQSELTPIIFVTSYSLEEMKTSSLYANGAVDFLFAPVAPEELRGKVSAFAHLYSHAATLAARAERVQNSADQLMLLTDAAPIGIFQTAGDGKFVYTNPRWTELTGLSANDALGTDWDSLVTREGWEELLDLPTERVTMRGSSSRRFKLGTRTAGASIVLVTAEAIPANDGGVAGWVGTLADVTGEHGAEEERARFRSLVQNSRDVIAIVDASGMCTYISPGVVGVGGYTQEDAIGVSGFEFIHPDDKAIVASHLSEIVVRPDEMKTVEVRTRTKAGDWTWIEIRATNRLDDPSIQGIVINYHDITERRLANDRLSQSEQLLADGQAISHVGSFTWDMGDDSLAWSDEQYRLLGYEPGEIEAGFDVLLERIHPDDRAAFSEGCERSSQAGEPFDQDMRIVVPEGPLRWIHGKGEATLEDGVPVALVGTSHDITSIKEAENERIVLLAQQQHLATQLRMLLDSTGEGIYGLDNTGACTFMNKAGATLLGGDASDFVGRHMHELTHHTHEDGSAFPRDECPLFGALSTGRPVKISGGLVWRLDGTSVPVDFSSYPIGGDGSSEGAVVTFQDVTVRKEMEQDLQKNEQLFRGAFDAAQTGIALIASDGLTYVDVNQAMCDMLGYTKEELLLLDWAQITHPDDLARNRQEFGEVFAGRLEVGYISKRYLGKDGQCVSVEISDTVVRDAAGETMYFVTHANDVTEREHSAADKEGLQTQLRQAQKMEAVGQLAGGVAHDFNNILAVVLNYAEFVSETLAEDHEGQADLEQIVKAGERGAELVHQLLAFSRQEIIEPRVIDLNEIIGGMAILLDRSVGEEVAIAINTDSGLHLTKADHGQIEQVLLNLVVNARDAMPEGGQITLRTRNAEVASGEFAGLQAGDYVCLTVTDTGGGIDEQILEHIFEPFFTTKPHGQGTGLGLATAYGILKRARGGIYAESTPEGTTFSLFLPETDEVEQVNVVVDMVPPSDSGATILVVEDEHAVRDLIERILRREDFEVFVASSGADAVEICRQHPGTIDLLLTDVVMPEMSGPALRDIVKPIRPQMNVLFMSGYTDELIAKRGVLEAGESLLSKPFNSAELLVRVRQALHPTEPIDPVLEVVK